MAATVTKLRFVSATMRFHSYYFSHSIKLRGLSLSELSSHCLANYLPRCLRSRVTCGKTPTTV